VASGRNLARSPFLGSHDSFSFFLLFFRTSKRKSFVFINHFQSMDL